MRVAAVRIFVTRLDGAMGFYATLLGPPRSRDADGAFAVFDGEGSDIIVEAVTDNAPPEDRALVGRFAGISFAVDDLDRAYRELTAAGFRVLGSTGTPAMGRQAGHRHRSERQRTSARPIPLTISTARCAQDVQICRSASGRLRGTDQNARTERD